MQEYLPCFGCGAKSLNIEGECHAYMLASPGCWGMFNEIMAREFSDQRYWMAHQYTVDAYAAQHVGREDDKRAMNSVHIHLASLYVLFEEGASLQQAPRLREQFSRFYKGKDLLRWLEPPESYGEMTIFDPWANEDPDSHYAITEQWARSVWSAWSHQHQRIAELVEQTRRKT